MPKDGENTYDLVIARGITIEPGSSNKQSYTLEIKYLDSTEDQSIDMGSTVTGSLYIVESTTNENNPYTKGTLGYKIMEDNSNIKTRTDFSTTYTDVNIGTMYKAKEDNTDVYYFAGDARNNWVKFGKNANNQDLYWRIIRTNKDNSVRLLYHGTSPETEEAYIDNFTINLAANNSMYVGYMYGTSGTLANNRLNTNNSSIKDKIDTWYEKNMTSYTKYLSTTAVYCNDREVGSGTYSATGDEFYYAGYTRLITNKTPSYDCTVTEDKFTVDSSTGNGKLTYPIALMTADEVSYAGGLWVEDAATWYYLNNKGTSSINTDIKEWWLMTPAYWHSSKIAVAFKVSSYENRKAQLRVQRVFDGLYIRPVISLKKDLIYKSGDGSASKPYEVEDMPDTLSERLLSDKSTRPSGPRGTGFDKVYTENNTKTLYTSTEDSKTVYYFAGNATDNWVKFGKNESNQDLYWRIIRTNSDGSVRLLYHGTSTTATDTYIGTSGFHGYIGDIAYLSYMYGSLGSISNARTNQTNSSRIKTTIDNWYKDNLNTNYGKYLSTTAVYCNDRTYTVSGSDTRFGAYTRLYTNKTPSYDCATTEDKFTADSSTGNGKLTYPIALMTADEVSFAGGVWLTRAETWYYKNSANGSSTGETNWLLLSPFACYESRPRVFSVDGSSSPGLLGNYDVISTHGVRPAISLKSCTLYSTGDGSASDPYTIKETPSGC